MRVLVAGGAGYIGSHVVLALQQVGHHVVVLDNLQTGHQEAVKNVPFVLGDIADEALLSRLISEHNIEAAVHLAAESTVGISMQDPGIFFKHNMGKGAIFLDTLVKSGVKILVFSSSAAVYGSPDDMPIRETDPLSPINVYGATKMMFEEMMRWYEQVYGLRWIALRYFNAAGAAVGRGIGEDHNPETHLIPIILHTALGQRKKLNIFGNDYPTPDGTCIRDYVHVSDLSRAHVLAMDALYAGEAGGIYNLGNGQGFSVQEVVKVCERVTGQKITAEISPRRSGDPPILVASSDKITSDLGWAAQHPDLESIVRSAWEWHRSNPWGYNKQVLKDERT
ncbi:udp-glucose 4-epimerase [hydrocarbon metagenome]|uniref:Udp-glucose 4-epimerase n=1 Tax=hydrocarbon metagenome TaxID=938273 RepID=A0A0W8E2M8_9ZZZZ